MFKFLTSRSLICGMGFFAALSLCISASADAPVFKYGLTNINGCSGAVFRLEDSKPTDKALIMTAGHCAQMGSFEGMPAQGEKFLNLSVAISAGVGTMNAGKNLVEVQITRLLIATTTDTDMAIYEANQTYEELTTLKVDLLTLPKVPPIANAGADVIVPEGYSYATLRTRFDRYVNATKEGPYLWKRSFLLKKQSGIGPGASGAPVVLAGTKLILGIVNSGSEGSDPKCSMSHPCLVDVRGKATPAPLAAPIAQPMNQIYDCLTVDRKVDLRLPGCKL